MENQNPNQQANAEQQNPPNQQGSLPPEFVGLPPTSQLPSPEERLVVAEKYVSELLKAYQMTGVAINRLETHIFSLMKIMFDNNVATWEGFVTARAELMENEDLLVFWKVKEIDDRLRAEAEEAAKTSGDVAGEGAEKEAVAPTS